MAFRPGYTLSWARLGARCTGLDIAPVAIRQARELGARSGLSAQFVCTDLCSRDPGGREPFDIVYCISGRKAAVVE